MTAQLVVHGFETSNNMKVRVALGYKQIPYEFRTIDPRDRDELVRISGQHLTPVLQHRGRVLFDSAAIIRYLEANFLDTPRLFGGSHAQQWEIEDWELFGRLELAGPMMQVVHRRMYGRDVDTQLLEDCQESFASRIEALAGRLRDRDWLVGEQMSVADITCAAVVFRVRSAKLFALPPAVEELLPWVGRVMGYDGLCRVEPPAAPE